jgi:hypothetical protein
LISAVAAVTMSVPMDDSHDRLDQSGEPQELDAVDGVVELEEVDALPVLAEARELARPHPNVIPAVQALAAAATGFVAGAATLALLRRYGGNRVARDVRALGDARDLRESLTRRPADPWAPGASYTYMVSIRVITRPSE